jgi:AAA domain/Winged helix-turn-helix DNA-binding
MTTTKNLENDSECDVERIDEASGEQQNPEGAGFHPYGIPGQWEKGDPQMLEEAEQKPTPSIDAGQKTDRWTARGFQDAMRGSQGRPPWIIEDLLLAESATLVSAQPHALKSLSLLSACLDAVTIKKVWGHFAAPNVDSVLFLETEDPAWMVELRIRGLAKGLGIGEKNEVPGFHYACVGPFDFLSKENRIEELVQNLKPNFIVLSTLQNLLNGRAYNRQEDMQPVMAAMIRFAQSAPLVLVTHSPWDKRQKRAAGSVTQTANFLTALHYEKRIARKTGETFVHVSVDSKAGALETDFSLKLVTDGSPRDPGSIRKVTYNGAGWPKGTGKAAILAELEEDPDASASEIAERTGMTQRYVQQIVKQQAEEKKKAQK